MFTADTLPGQKALPGLESAEDETRTGRAQSTQRKKLKELFSHGFSRIDTDVKDKRFLPLRKAGKSGKNLEITGYLPKMPTLAKWINSDRRNQGHYLRPFGENGRTAKIPKYLTI